MTAPFRTKSVGRNAERRTVRFSFDGNTFEGREGDTLASALLANGVHLVGRSYKYHRPRGIFSAGAEEPNALVGVSRGPGRFAPNLRATQIELYDGLEAKSQNRWRSTGSIGPCNMPKSARRCKNPRQFGVVNNYPFTSLDPPPFIRPPLRVSWTETDIMCSTSFSF